MPNSDFPVHRRLYHINAEGCFQSITFRLEDSCLGFKMRQLNKAELAGFSAEEQKEKLNRLAVENQWRMQSYLDQQYGSCILKDPVIASMVLDSIFAGNGREYVVIAWSIMSNHVHLLLLMLEKDLGHTMMLIKSRSATSINRYRHTIGKPVWAASYFDRYIRSYEHFVNVLHYILNNPLKSHCSAEFTGCIENWRNYAEVFLQNGYPTSD